MSELKMLVKYFFGTFIQWRTYSSLFNSSDFWVPQKCMKFEYINWVSFKIYGTYQHDSAVMVRGVSGGPWIGPPWCRQMLVSRTAIRLIFVVFLGWILETSKLNVFIIVYDILFDTMHNKSYFSRNSNYACRNI